MIILTWDIVNTEKQAGHGQQVIELHHHQNERVVREFNKEQSFPQSQKDISIYLRLKYLFYCY